MAMMTVTLPKHIYDEIVAHSQEGKPEEICGILRGRGTEAYELFRGDNEASDRVNNYTIDGKTLMKQFQFEETGDEMMGIYHSHPISVAYPSATDAWNAHYPESIYLICSTEFDDAPVIRAFRMLPHYIEIDIDALRATLSFEEVRSGLFGYFHAKDASAHEALAKINQQLSAPYYIVFFEEQNEIEDSRIVSIEEYAVEVV